MVTTSECPRGKRTLSLRTRKRTLLLKYLKKTQSLRNSKKDTTEDRITEAYLSGVSGPSMAFTLLKTLSGFLFIVCDRMGVGGKFSYESFGLGRPHFYATVNFLLSVNAAM